MRKYEGETHHLTLFVFFPGNVGMQDQTLGLLLRQGKQHRKINTAVFVNG
jgi:hypothetical protein